MTEPALDFDRVLKLRLLVARFGEINLAKRWKLRHIAETAALAGRSDTGTLTVLHSTILVALHDERGTS